MTFKEANEHCQSVVEAIIEESILIEYEPGYLLYEVSADNLSALHHLASLMKDVYEENGKKPRHGDYLYDFAKVIEYNCVKEYTLLRTIKAKSNNNQKTAFESLEGSKNSEVARLLEQKEQFKQRNDLVASQLQLLLAEVDANIERVKGQFEYACNNKHKMVFKITDYAIRLAQNKYNVLMYYKFHPTLAKAVAPKEMNKTHKVWLRLKVPNFVYINREYNETSTSLADYINDPKTKHLFGDVYYQEIVDA